MPRPTRLLPQKRPAGALAVAPQSAAAAAGPAHHYAGQGHIPVAAALTVNGTLAGGSSTIDRYYLSRHCAVCDDLTRVAEPLCEKCRSQPQMAAAVLGARTARIERQHAHLVRLCLHCGGGGGRNAEHGGIVCDSLECGLYYERRKVAHELSTLSGVAELGLQTLAAQF